MDAPTVPDPLLKTPGQSMTRKGTPFLYPGDGIKYVFGMNKNPPHHQYAVRDEEDISFPPLGKGQLR